MFDIMTAADFLTGFFGSIFQIFKVPLFSVGTVPINGFVLAASFVAMNLSLMFLIDVFGSGLSPVQNAAKTGRETSIRRAEKAARSQGRF